MASTPQTILPVTCSVTENMDLILRTDLFVFFPSEVQGHLNILRIQCFFFFFFWEENYWTIYGESYRRWLKIGAPVMNWLRIHTCLEVRWQKKKKITLSYFFSVISQKLPGFAKPISVRHLKVCRTLESTLLMKLVLTYYHVTHLSLSILYCDLYCCISIRFCFNTCCVCTKSSYPCWISFNLIHFFKIKSVNFF